uniref:Chromosome segregation and condensation protein ScpA n=1 Tax=Thermodesulfobacterium geofontis TaxID=1295609 RepID=A0A7V4JPX7_9BACT
MSVSETSLELYSTLEELRNKIFKNKYELIELNLTNIVLSAQKYLSLINLNEIFLEFLIRLSEAIYLKSCLLLNIHNEKEEKNENLEGPSFKEILEEKFNYYQALPFGRILFEKIFLSRIPYIFERADKKSFAGEKEKNLILRAILSVLSKEEVKEEILKNFSSLFIDPYLENLKKYLEKKLSFSFRELIKEKKETEFLKIAYYFLALLFLYLEGFCYMVQNSENEDIIIFSKRHL